MRNPKLSPYPWNSIWNTPLGDTATLVDFAMTTPTVKTLRTEEDILMLDPTYTEVDIMAHDDGWSTGDRCGSRTGATHKTAMPIDTSMGTEGLYLGTTPNHSTAILLADDTMWETQPFHICNDAVPVSQFHNATWGEGQGNNIRSGGLGDSPHGGSHGGSKMSAMGGVIRVGEWVVGGAINHAIKINVDANANLYGGGANGHRWPANAADTGWAADYNGSVVEALMGALLCLKTTFDVTALTEESAKIIATCLKEYGAYIVDSTGNSSAMLAVEWSPAGRVYDDFQTEFGYDMEGLASSATGSQKDFLDDMNTIWANLWIVDDNASGVVGGSGDRLAEYAPSFNAVDSGKQG